MSNYAYFYNSNDGDRVYDADSMTDWLLPFFTTGVFNGQLQVTANDDMTVTVGAGYCNVKGKVKHFLNKTTFDLETASGTLNRIDNVILRRDDTKRDIYLMIVTGGNAATPTAPALERSGAIYDLKLAEIYITAGTITITQAEITDCRMDADVCGWVASTVKEIDFSQATEQFKTFFDAYQKKIAKDYAEYLETLGYTEERAEAAYNNFVAIMQGYQKEQEAAFEMWFETMKDKLSEDIAGKMQVEIDNLQAMIDNLAFKISIDYQLEFTRDATITLTNTTTGSKYKATVNSSGVAFKITEAGNYTAECDLEETLLNPKAFSVDHNRVMTEMSITLREGNNVGYIGNYIGSFITQ